MTIVYRTTDWIPERIAIVVKPAETHTKRSRQIAAAGPGYNRNEFPWRGNRRSGRTVRGRGEWLRRTARAGSVHAGGGGIAFIEDRVDAVWTAARRSGAASFRRRLMPTVHAGHRSSALDPPAYDRAAIVIQAPTVDPRGVGPVRHPRRRSARSVEDHLLPRPRQGHVRQRSWRGVRVEGVVDAIRRNQRRLKI